MSFLSGLKKQNSFMRKDRTIIGAKIKQSFMSVLPISLIVLFIAFIFVPIESGVFLAFIFSFLILIVGMGLFTLGAETAMTPIGEYVGTSVIMTKNLWIIMPVIFLVGILITISEPDLQVLAEQLKDIISPSILLVITIGVGVGLFLLFAFLRIVLQVKLQIILIASYATVFILAMFVPETFVPIAFDSGGVTTGPMSVPFIIALGTGIASMRMDKAGQDDSFGLTALCSVGPILSVMILGLAFGSSGQATGSATEVLVIENSQDLINAFLTALPIYMFEVLNALGPIVLFFIVIRLIFGKNDKINIFKIIIGILYTYFGLVFFLVGVNVGFLSIGGLLGEMMGKLDYFWIVVPIGMIIGFFVVTAEPSVQVLTEQVFDITDGAIPKKALSLSLGIGVAFSIGLTMLRIIFKIPIMYLLGPGYLIAIVLTFFVPDIFTAVAFDSGGVASGAMTTGFVLPFATGFCAAIGGDVSVDGFGLVAMVAMTPLIAIQILGLVYKIKMAKLKKKDKKDVSSKEEIIG